MAGIIRIILYEKPNFLRVRRPDTFFLSISRVRKHSCASEGYPRNWG